MVIFIFLIVAILAVNGVLMYRTCKSMSHNDLKLKEAADKAKATLLPRKHSEAYARIMRQLSELGGTSACLCSHGCDTFPCVHNGSTIDRAPLSHGYSALSLSAMSIDFD